MLSAVHTLEERIEVQKKLTDNEREIVEQYFQHNADLPPETVAYGDIPGTTKDALLQRLQRATYAEKRAILESIEGILKESHEPNEQYHRPRAIA